MNSATQQAVYDLLKDFARKSLKRYDVEALKQAYPFHRLFFEEAGLIAFKQERSIVTKMGQQLYPALAERIARERHRDVALEHEMVGVIGKTTADEITTIVRELRSRQRQPNHVAEAEQIARAGAASDDRTVEVRVIADLYIGDFRGGPFFAEIKTPQPNLDICAETKQKILTFAALMPSRPARGYMAFPYNPFVTRAAYTHSFTKRVMDMDDEVLMAGEFWDMIGSRGTFKQMLEIIERVGNDLRKEKR